jgi:peptidoglycan/xylan/chitin deacetylase (PgdA/CDA1 family)
MRTFVWVFLGIHCLFSIQPANAQTVSSIPTHHSVWDNILIRSDDDPYPQTVSVVQTLQALGIKHAVFAVIGKHAERYPEALRAIDAAGYTIVNHSYSHPLFNQRAIRRKFEKNPDALRTEIEKTDAAIGRALGRPFRSTLFAVPGGAHYLPQSLKAVVTTLGISIDTGWTIDTHDSCGKKQRMSSATVAKLIRENRASGKRIVILIHSRKGGWEKDLRTVDALIRASS